jgi:hypothetical protein
LFKGLLREAIFCFKVKKIIKRAKKLMCPLAYKYMKKDNYGKAEKIEKNN